MQIMKISPQNIRANNEIIGIKLGDSELKMGQFADYTIRNYLVPIKRLKKYNAIKNDNLGKYHQKWSGLGNVTFRDEVNDYINEYLGQMYINYFFFFSAPCTKYVCFVLT